MQHLETYQSPDTQSSANLTGSVSPSVLGDPDGRGNLLVNRFKTQIKKERKFPVKRLLVYPRAVKMVRDFRYQGRYSWAARGEISSFTPQSKKRLKFKASNSFPELISQFGMTYHKTIPDGRTTKKHLNQFLTELRQTYPYVKYLWILEFQSRGVPHYHLFLSLSHGTKGLHKYLAETWHRIAEPKSREHKRFHIHEKNFIPWDMGSGSYLCKYLDKEHQKVVPKGFTGVGRFWGTSRNLVPEPIAFECDYSQYDNNRIDENTGEIKEDFKATEYVVRTICKHHEKSLRNSPWRSSARTRPTSYTLPNAAKVLWQIEKYLEKQKLSDEVPF